MSDFDNQLFVKVCELEARMELSNKKLYEAEQKLKAITVLLEQAIDMLKDKKNDTSNQ